MMVVPTSSRWASRSATSQGHSDISGPSSPAASGLPAPAALLERAEAPSEDLPAEEPRPRWVSELAVRSGTPLPVAQHIAAGGAQTPGTPRLPWQSAGPRRFAAEDLPEPAVLMDMSTAAKRDAELELEQPLAKRTWLPVAAAAPVALVPSGPPPLTAEQRQYIADASSGIAGNADALVAEVLVSSGSLPRSAPSRSLGGRGATAAPPASRPVGAERSQYALRKHPLRELDELVEKDRRNERPYLLAENSSFSGTWSMPGRYELRSLWYQSSAHGRIAETEAPLLAHCDITSMSTSEISALAATARREMSWNKMSPAQQSKWQLKATAHWTTWLENNAVEVLDGPESEAVTAKLAAEGHSARILDTRWILTDKSDGLRTPSKPLPEEPSARLIAPGYKDEAFMKGELRSDAPTGARLS